MNIAVRHEDIAMIGAGGYARINMQARQAVLHLQRDEILLKYVGAPRGINMQAHQDVLDRPRDERDPDMRVGGPRMNMQAR